VNEGENENRKPETKRPLDPTTGAMVLMGSLAVAAGVTWILSLALPFGEATLARLPFELTSQGVWLVIGSWLIYPAVLAAFLLRLARGVDPMRLAVAFAGMTYFLQCWAELTVRDHVSLWPELLFTAVPTLVFHSRALKDAPKPERDGSEPPA